MYANETKAEAGNCVYIVFTELYVTFHDVNEYE